MTITNFKVTFSRQVRPGDYENANAEVSYSGTVDEGEDAFYVAAEALAKAKTQALAAVGKAPRVQPDAETVVVTEREPASEAEPAGEMISAEDKRSLSAKKAAATRAANKEKKATEAALEAERVAQPDAAASVLDGPAEPAAEAALDEPAAMSAANAADDGEISDAELQTRVAAIATAIPGGGKKIKELMKSLTIARLRDVEPGERAAFLIAAEALK